MYDMAPIVLVHNVFRGIFVACYADDFMLFLCEESLLIDLLVFPLINCPRIMNQS